MRANILGLSNAAYCWNSAPGGSALGSASFGGGEDRLQFMRERCEGCGGSGHASCLVYGVHTLVPWRSDAVSWREVRRFCRRFVVDDGVCAVVGGEGFVVGVPFETGEDGCSKDHAVFCENIFRCVIKPVSFDIEVVRVVIEVGQAFGESTGHGCFVACRDRGASS